MTEKTYRISGKIVDVKSRAGIPGLRVEAWDNDLIFDDRIGSAVTDEKGNFLIEFRESYFSDIFLERSPDLFFKIYKNRDLAYATRNNILWNVRTPELDIVIEIPPGGGEINPNEPMLRVYGIVRNELGEPLAGVNVKAFDVPDSQGKTPDTPLGETHSDQNGLYRIEFSEAAFKNTAAERGGPNLVVRVYDKNGQQIGQSKQVNNAGHITELNVDINAAPYRVHGVVLDGDGAPLSNHTVRAFDRDLRWEEPLGEETQTDASGFYEIKYTPEQFQRSEKGLADLIVRVYGEQNIELISSTIIFNADPDTVVNLSLPGADPRGLSEFDNLVREITPLLRDVPQHELTEDDIAFLAADISIDRRYILWLAESARRHVDAVIVDQFVFYGLFRQNLPTVLDDLLTQELSTLRDALEKSSQDHVIKRLSSEELDAIIAKLHTLQADHATVPGSTGEPSTLGDLLRTVLSDADKIRAVAQLYITHSNRVSDEFFAELKAPKQFSDQELTDIRLALQLGELTGIYLPLVRELQRMAKFEPLYTPTGNLSPYVSLTLDDWKAVLHRSQPNGDIIGAPATVAGENIEEKIINYALSLSEQLEGAFPSTTIVRRLEEDTGQDSPFKDGHADMMTFFGNNPSFNLFIQPLDIYLSSDADAKLAGVKDREAFTTMLKGIQRVAKLTPDYAAIRTLISNGLHSAQAVVAGGQYYFIQQFSYILGGDVKAWDVYRTAQHIQNTAMAVYMNNAPAFRSPLPYVIAGQSATAQSAWVEKNRSLANWTRLFGSLELCECRHCRSLYSPAAYLVDTLNFIKNAPMKCETTALDNLLSWRRPDIEHIELTCDNSNTPMPYVDLVNELLEAAVAPRGIKLVWNEDVITKLDKQNIDYGLIVDLKDHNFTLTDKASVRIDALGSNWTILDSSWVFVLSNHGEMEGMSAIAWPQTSWSAKELKANPEHTDIVAYNKLRTAVYPWRLPFNLQIEEARVYLQHLAVRRHEVLAIFMRGASPHPESDYQVAYEYLGLTPEEAAIINGSTTGGPMNASASPGPWDFWGLRETDNYITDPADNSVGEAQGTWVEVLKRVSIFLQQSGLSYREMLDLLDTNYVNPRNVDGPNGRSLAIVAADERNQMTCNTAKLVLYAVGDDLLEYVAAYNKTHRFVRLARKLGWTMRDLDKAIETLQPHQSGEIDITNDFLVQLSHIQRLSVEKHVPVINLLSFWADIDHTQYIDHITDGEPVIPSLYAQMFLSKTLDTQGFPDDPSQLVNQKISERAAAIAAAYGIGADDVDRLHADPMVIHLIRDTANNTKMIQDDNLTLGNLSRLYRHALLARIVGLPICQYLPTLRLIASNPFAPAPPKLNTAMTLDFVKAADLIASSGFSVGDLYYLLRHTSESTLGLAITDADIGAALDVIRADLRQVAAENTFVNAAPDGNVATTDPDGELTRKKLASLNWGAIEIDTVVAVLNGTSIFEAELTSLVAAIRFPVTLGDRISYDATAQRLRFKGIMSSVEKAELLASPNYTDPSFRDALGVLYKGPRTFFERQMRRFAVPEFEYDLPTLPSGLEFPNTVKNKVYFDKATKKLRCIGVMTATERSILENLSNDQGYRRAISTLFDAPEVSPVGDADQFLTPDDVNDLFDNPNTKSAQRFELVLSRLLPFLRKTLSERMVKQRLAEHTGLDASTIDGLLNAWVLVPGTTGATRPVAMTTFVDLVFTGSNADLQVTPVSFPQQFATYLLLHKIATVISKFAFSADVVRAVFEHGSARSWLDLDKLPLVPADNSYALFPGWSRLADLSRLCDTLPHGASAVSDWLAAAYAAGAQPQKVIEALSRATQWNRIDLQSLAGTNGFSLDLNALRSETIILRLANAMALLKRLCATADQCLAWTRNATGDDAYSRDRAQAQDIQNLVRAKYDPAQWLEVAGTLRDPLREKQRAALVDYLVATRRLKDANALYAELLIDVEMSPCMMTTRIKQAISSVQLYVQRTLMNLEECAELGTDRAKQWAAWRKQYRVWEANRKVLLYPENWIEPELRDDKTPFFKDLENELLQNDITADIAEDAFIHYLEKLDQVARLDIVGMYEDRDGGKSVLHVMGRTVGVPHIYFYRRLENTVWTAWEKIELDIEGDHLIPVVWNRRLHLFWAIFTEKSEQSTPNQRRDHLDPTKYWEIKLAWSEYKNKGWSPKKISTTSLQRPRQLPTIDQVDTRDFSFKTIMIQGLYPKLTIACYGKVVDQYQIKEPPLPQGQIATTNTEYLGTFLKHTPDYWMKVLFRILNRGEPNLSQASNIKVNFLRQSDRTTISQGAVGLDIWGAAIAPDPVVRENIDCYLVSPSFKQVFVEQKNMIGGLYLDVVLTDWSPPPANVPAPQTKVVTEPKDMIGIGEFRFDDCHGDIAAIPVAQLISSMIPERLEPIQGTQIRGMAMVEHLNFGDTLGKDAVLRQTPGEAFRLLLPNNGYVAKKFSFPFFFQDQYRTYFVPLHKVSTGGVGGFKLRFSTFFHPRMCEFIKSLKRYGVDELLTLENQRYTDSGAGFFGYLPNASLVDLDSSDDAIPKEDIDFRPEGAYSQYNWELFFHAPFLIATQLGKNQRFEEAQKWFHYIFDPTSTVSAVQGPERFWKVLPFYNEAARGAQTLEELLADSANLEEQVRESATKPFNPHAIARMRIVAYMKTVVMHYIDNLLAWGDQLFGRNTIESINEATQLYILAAEILGKRLQSIPPRVAAKVQTYSTLYDSLGPDSLSNALVEMEGYIFPSAAPVNDDGTSPTLAPIPYFCTAPNEKLLGYWDVVADRLFKIRHCMNLAGVERSLPIYEPPIDPALLVKATAAGVDVASALSDINAAVPHYRFGVVMQKATELCNDVKSLGGALLSALEKRDAEALSLLRSSHEIDVLKALRQVKEQQAKEASANLAGLNEYQKVITARRQYYQSRVFMNQFELTQLALTTASLVPTTMQLGAEVTAAVLHLIPDTKVGAPTTVGATYGGRNVAGAVQAFGSVAGTTASMLNTVGSMAATVGGHHRRQEDWT
ncbi:MAG: Tc toxin subunit A, partial [Gammaproteobacteria bacterium]|nr:Tc toxin subunit A [Gammaproteobacteria bacterium]